MNITLIEDKFGITKPKVFTFDGVLLDWLISHYGEDGANSKIAIYKSINGELIEVGKSYNELNNYYSDIVIMQNPLGVEWLWVAYAVLVVASFVLIKPPRLQNQNDGSDRKTSPNNGLDGQTNLARRLQRIPEMFGKNKSYPDLISESFYKYVDQNKTQTEVFCIGRGFYQLEDFKTGDTLISSIEEAELEIFEPFEEITNLEKVVASSSVTNQELLTLLSNSITNDNRIDDWLISYDSITDKATIYDSGSTNAFEFLNENDEIVITDLNANMDWDTPAIPYAASISFSETDRRKIIVYEGSYYAPLSSSLPFVTETWTSDASKFYLISISPNLAGTYIVDAITGEYNDSLVLKDASTVSSAWTTLTYLDAVAQNVGTIYLSKDISVGPFVAPNENYSKILFDIEAPQGIARGNALNESISIDIDLIVQQIDSGGNPIGLPLITRKTIEGRSVTPRFYTFEIDVTPGTINEVSVERITEVSPTETRAERVVWARLASSKIVAGVDIIGTTRARLTLRANEQTINIQDRKFNCIATRKCVTWNGTSVVGNLTTGVGLVVTQKVADCFLTYFVDPKLANKNSNLLNIESLYLIQNSLSELKGQFNFTFDSDSSSAQEELFIIADSCRCFITKTGSYHDVTRDQKQNSPKRLINRALKKPNSERKTISFNQETSNDGVELTYLDFDSSERKTIILPNDLPSYDDLYESPETENPLKINAVGITNYAQAWDRAQYEWRRLVFKRVSIKVGTGASIGTLPLNSRVEYADGTLPANIVGKSDGFVKSIDGLEIVTSEECEFIAGIDHEVYLTTENGSAQGPYSVEPLAHTFGFKLLGSPAEPIYARGGESDYQRGSCYIFRALSYQTNSMLLQRKTPTDDFFFDVELINYEDEYYAADEQTPP